MATYFLQQWSNISLSSAVNASEEVHNDLLNAESVGKTKWKEFIDNQIKKNSISFYDVIKKNQLKNFSTIKQVKKLNVNGKDVIIQADQSFARILILQEKRSISTRELESIHLDLLLGHLQHQKKVFTSM